MKNRIHPFYFDGSHSSSRKEINHLVEDGFDVKNLIIKLGTSLERNEIKELAPILMKAVIRESDLDKLKVIC